MWPDLENAHYWLTIQPLVSAPYKSQMRQAHAAHYREAIQDCSCTHEKKKKTKGLFFLATIKTGGFPQITTAIREIVPSDRALNPAKEPVGPQFIDRQDAGGVVQRDGCLHTSHPSFSFSFVPAVPERAQFFGWLPFRSSARNAVPRRISTDDTQTRRYAASHKRGRQQ